LFYSPSPEYPAACCGELHFVTKAQTGKFFNVKPIKNKDSLKIYFNREYAGNKDPLYAFGKIYLSLKPQGPM
jgi:hypothetical protein